MVRVPSCQLFSAAKPGPKCVRLGARRLRQVTAKSHLPQISSAGAASAGPIAIGASLQRGFFSGVLS